jgi:uncharacterized phage protein (TIGR02218 family)
MKTPIWEPSAGAMVAWLLTATQARPVDLWTFTLNDGTVYRWTGGDTSTTAGPATWTLGPGLIRGPRKQTIGVSVDTLRLTIYPGNATVKSLPILVAIQRQLFNNATVRLDHAFFDDSGACKGIAPGFFGRFSDVTISRSSADVLVVSHSELLDVMVPGAVYQPTCRNTLFDANCKALKTNYVRTGSVATVPDTTRRNLTSATAAITALAAGWGNLGVLTFISGACTGESRMVRVHNGGTLQMVSPFVNQFAVNDTFTLTAGCNKVYAGDCAAKFSNQANFRGEPFIPAPETVT